MLKNTSKFLRNLHFFQRLIFTVLLFSNCTAFADEYYSMALRGAKTVLFQFSEEEESPCSFKHTIEAESAPLIKEMSDMGITPMKNFTGDSLPDLTVVLTIETSPKSIDNIETMCPFMVKVEAIHTMSGTFRYWQEPNAIRAIAFRQIAYGVVPKSQLDEALSKTGLRLLAMFGFEYFKANIKDKKE